MFGPSPFLPATSASADFCPITPRIAARGAAFTLAFAVCFARSGRQQPERLGLDQPAGPSGFYAIAPAACVGQISPNKNMRFRCTTAAFTLPSDTMGFVMWC
jgi:hypothetical protein